MGATNIYTPTGVEDLADLYIEPTPQAPILSILKRNAPIREASQSQLVDEMTVAPATEHIYRIQFRNTGNGPTTSPVTITDNMPA